MVRHETVLKFDATILLDTYQVNLSNINQEFVIASRVLDERCVVLDLQGIFNGASEAVFAKEFQENTEKYKNIILNLSRLSHIDPGGAGLLVAYASLAAQKHVSLAACGAQDSFRDVFRLTRLDEEIPIFGSEEEAYQGLHARKGGSFLPQRGISYEGPPLRGWARAVDRISLGDIPAEAMNINIDGKETTSPVTGFGRLWDKRYILRLHNSAPEPQQIIALWRSEFPRFWPPGNRVFPSGNAPIAPGTAAVLNLTLPGGVVLATGVVVIYADERSFSFITIQGHILSGWITFSSFQHNGSTYIQVNPLFRASDPLIELSMQMGAARQEDIFWHTTLTNLAQRLGVRGELSQRDVLIDPHVRWNAVAALRHSAAIRSFLYMPVFMVKKVFTF